MPMAPAPTEVSVTSTPSSRPRSTVGTARPLDAAGRPFVRHSGGVAADKLPEQETQGSQHHGGAYRNRNQMGERWAMRREERHNEDRGQRAWHRAQRQETNHPPFDITPAGMHARAGGLGDSRVKQIGARRREGVHAEKQYKHAAS